MRDMRAGVAGARSGPGAEGGVPDVVESFPARAISSGGERFVHTEEVTGSIPVSPTQLRGHFPSMGMAFFHR